ncbi:hypothetical protein Clacol_001673 [Clathrus columnatus]|uniref:Uncharacterized protein n=1 Tax=Clathrus columnatus TaxID=1419009 RepID=A0AAV4ZYS0_9AGAM|nr:hypothetical protein Clacol_001673 [Clathrus columnatus]
MDPDSPTEAPPPAYDAQEFDRKISVALDMSMDPALQTVEEEWEEWSDDRFEAARRQQYSESTNTVSRQNSKKSYRVQSPNLSGQSSSSSYSAISNSPHYATGTRSRRLPSFPPKKERPSWYTEAHLHLPARSDNVVQLERTRTPPISQHDIPMDDDFNDFDEPLPPFAPVGPSLDGPPFEEIAPYYPPRAPVPYSNSPPRPSYQNSVTPPAQRRPVNRPVPRPRPMASPPLSTSNGYHPPPMPFDPGLAYARQRQTVTAFRPREDDSGPVDPALLYNSAVASVMKKSKSMQPLKKTLPNRDRSNETNDRRSFDAQSTRSYAESMTSYQGSSHIPRVAQYAIPSLPTLSTQYMSSQPLTSTNFPTLPTLPTLPVDEPGSYQSDPRNMNMPLYYNHSNASEWSQTAGPYGRVV